MIEYYTVILSFKTQNWVLCNHPSILADAIDLMEAYATVEAGLYLIPKAWKKKTGKPGSRERHPEERGHEEEAANGCEELTPPLLLTNTGWPKPRNQAS